ncbi:MAG: sodium/proton-translocating pyrophosphatase, partial [Dysgonamonadaceae bacterium]|nr:sodium/proton-translocating pyrophosphatase [Dysgonamonadaceae bacterium]
MKKRKNVALLTSLFCSLSLPTYASEADLAIPDLHTGTFHIFGGEISAWNFLFWGAIIIAGTLAFSLLLRNQVRKLPAHDSMLKVAQTIYSTCRTYLEQQGKFLLMLFGLVAVVLCIYFFGLLGQSVGVVLQVLLFSIVGMGGSYAVAWYGIRVNTYANARTAFASLKGRPLDVVNIPLKAGMSVGLFLISLELVMMVIILLFVPRDIVGICFLGFAIGESLGASALRIAGGIFTKIADIGSDLMKVVFKVKEDDPRNPGVIADCTGDNAGDSVGPTADGFETYGVTGVALITFITLAVPNPDLQAKLIVWIFGMRFLMDFLSGCSFFINQGISKKLYGNKKDFDFEAPLMRLIVIAAVLCISASFVMSHLLLGDLPDPTLWWKLAVIIGCGTLGALLIPEFTKYFTSSKSRHVKEIVIASREGGPSLNILSGIVAGYFG